MFKKALLRSASRIDALGQYQSPNICFIDDEDDRDGGENDQDAGQVDEEAGDGEGSDGEGADGEEGDDGEEGADREDGEDAEAEGNEESRAQVARETPRRRGASEVIRETKRAAKEAAAKADEATRRAEAAERRAEAAERAAVERRQVESAAQERERVSLMTQEEKDAFYRQKDKDDANRQIQGLQFQVWESSDRASFRELCREDPLIARVKERVEAEYEKLKSQGRPVEREIIANQEIAKMMRDQQKSASTKQRNRGAESVRRETARPVQTRSAVSAQRTRRGNENTPEARRKRLEGVII